MSALLYQGKLQYFNSCISHPRIVNRYEDTIYGQSTVRRIDKKLDQLQEKYQFIHNFISFEDMKKDDSVKSAKRVIKMRFKCRNINCPEFKMRDQQRRWTSYNGLIDFQFFFTSVKTKTTSMPSLTYTLKIFRQKCISCRQWGKSGLIQSSCKLLINLYGLLLQRTLHWINKKITNIPWCFDEKFGKKIQSSPGIFTSHMKSLCEACQKGVCLRFYPPNDAGVRRQKIEKRIAKPKQGNSLRIINCTK